MLPLCLLGHTRASASKVPVVLLVVLRQGMDYVGQRSRYDARWTPEFAESDTMSVAPFASVRTYSPTSRILRLTADSPAAPVLLKSSVDFAQQSTLIWSLYRRVQAHV